MNTDFLSWIWVLCYFCQLWFSKDIWEKGTKVCSEDSFSLIYASAVCLVTLILTTSLTILSYYCLLNCLRKWLRPVYLQHISEFLSSYTLSCWEKFWISTVELKNIYCRSVKQPLDIALGFSWEAKVL